jgi:hypothetical protein
MKRLLMFVAVFIMITGPVAADNRADNPLDPLYSAEKVNWAIQVDGMYPQLKTDIHKDSVVLRDTYFDNRHTFYFNVSKPVGVKKSFIYIFTGGYDCLIFLLEPCEGWTVRFNGNQLASFEHTNSTGYDPRGDGTLGGGLRQTIRFEVTNYVVDGENSLFIQGNTWQQGSEQIKIYGVMLITFYTSAEEHEYWLYNGVEFLQPTNVFEDFFYGEDLTGATYTEDSKGTLYTVTGIVDGDLNGFEENDAMYFNDILLEPNASNYLLETQNSSHLDIVKFDVSDYLDGSDSIKFTYVEDPERSGFPQPLYLNIPFYPSIFILDVESSDRTPPGVSFTSPANNTSFEESKTAHIFFSIDDPEASVTLEIDGSEVSPSKIGSKDYQFSWDLAGVEAGITMLQYT